MAYHTSSIWVECPEPGVTPFNHRAEFGLDFNIPLDVGRLLVGDKVDITLTVQAVRQDA